MSAKISSRGAVISDEDLKVAIEIAEYYEGMLPLETFGPFPSYPETQEERIRKRLEASEQIAQEIKESGTHATLLEVHRTGGGRHPDDLYMPLNKWDETE